ncbi:hypothetical protein [Actinomadura nitritigenes]|uniref:hypothetical protein n=1 Tax=Actinomadura nitritigenes TaxID=134602 RepID=UPI003D8CFE93
MPKPTLRFRPRTVIAVVTVGLLALLTPAASASAHHPPKPGQVIVSGQIAHRRVLTFADLGSLPQHTVTVTFSSGQGQQRHTYTGPLLLDVADSVHPRFDAAVKNDQLRFFIAATAGDDYRAIVSWAEIDPDFAGTQALLAVTEDGAPLTAEGPRLVVPSDVKGGRYVTGVTRLYIGDTDRLVH